LPQVYQEHLVLHRRRVRGDSGQAGAAEAVVAAEAGDGRHRGRPSQVEAAALTKISEQMKVTLLWRLGIISFYRLWFEDDGEPEAAF